MPDDNQIQPDGTGVAADAGHRDPAELGDPVAAQSAAYHLDLALRALAGQGAALDAARRDLAAAQGALATAPALVAAHLNQLVREPDGDWMDGSDVIEKLGEWLTAHGQDDRNPADRTWCHEDCTWPMGPHHDACDPDPDAPRGPVVAETLVAETGDGGQVEVNLAQFHVDMISDGDGNGGLAWMHGCGRTVGWVELGDDLSEVLDAAVAHAVECTGHAACRVCGCTDDHACEGGCSWAEPDLCSRCAAPGGGVTIGPDGDGGTVLTITDPAMDRGAAMVPVALALASQGRVAAPAAPVNRACKPSAAAPGDPAPPRNLPLRERAGWTAAYALTVQLTGTGGHPGVTFHGIPGGLATDVAIELSDGTYLTTLVNPGAGYMKSPTGFGTGGLGSGCAALAHALCVAALGRWAVCGACQGTGKTTFDGDAATGPGDRPWREGDDPEVVAACFGCDGFGLGVHPKVYQRFKEQFISTVEAGAEWRISRARILTWLAAQDADPELAVAAVAAAIHYEAPALSGEADRA